MATSKPKVIVFGGCGFIGREVVRLLVSEDVAESVLVVDKVPPQMAWLGPKHQTAFKHDSVTFKSANLINPASVENVFDQQYDWAINAAGETKLGLVSTV
ncbi:NAD-dependent epimerase/dehydratase [Trinorchestia longiramus]|nr:NAD-dependent epimerase/dehydratase [Trinorchestia longiramus]